MMGTEHCLQSNFLICDYWQKSFAFVENAYNEEIRVELKLSVIKFWDRLFIFVIVGKDKR